MKLSSRGRFFNEDDLVEYDVLDYDIDASFSPGARVARRTARLKVRVKSYALGVLTLRFAEEFNVQSITSDELGRLMFLRVRNQNSVVVNLPSPVSRDFQMTLNIAYAGRIARSRSIRSRLTIAADRSGGQRNAEDLPFVPPEPNWLFSNRSHWYPQNQVTDYATATIRSPCPSTTSWRAASRVGSPTARVGEHRDPRRATRVSYRRQPVRYLGVVVSKFARRCRNGGARHRLNPGRRRRRPGRSAVDYGAETVGARNTIQLRSKPIDGSRIAAARSSTPPPTSCGCMQRLWATCPIESMTLAMVEHELPGGHSPGYFAVINNPLPSTPFHCRNDPAVFRAFPSSSSRTSSRINGGARPSAGRTITSSG